VQVFPGCTEAGQALVAANWLLACTEETTRGAVPLFVIVTACGVLVVPLFCTANAREVGERVTAGLPVWLPVSATVCGLFEALSLMVKVPV
jgi:hypothetical protein